MKEFLKKEYLYMFLIMMMIGGILYSKALLGISMGLFFLLSLYDLIRSKEIKSTFLTFIKKPEYSFFMLFFIFLLFSVFYNSITPYFLEILRVRLPFLLLPFAFFIMPKLNKKNYIFIWDILLLAVFVSTIIVLTNYALDYENINKGILKGHGIPTKIHHVRYSLIIAFSIIISVNFYLKSNSNKKKYLYAFYVIYLFLFIHFLSARSGILALYISLFILIVIEIIKQKKYKLLTWLFILSLALPYLGYKTIKPLNNRINYMIWDIKQFNEHKIKSNNDAGRLASLVSGWHLFKKNPILGTGTGNFYEEALMLYAKEFPDSKKKLLPHNQLLSTMAANGLIGLVFFLLAFFTPILINENYRNPILLALYIIIFVSFIFENTIGSAVGTAIFLVFSLLKLKEIDDTKSIVN